MLQYVLEHIEIDSPEDIRLVIKKMRLYLNKTNLGKRRLFVEIGTETKKTIDVRSGECPH